MNKDDFKQTLISQYSEFIEELIIESESVYRLHIDYDELDTKVRSLIQSARIDGLDESIVWDLLERKVPGYVRHVVSLNQKAAA